MRESVARKKLTLLHAAWIFYSWELHDLLPQDRTQSNYSHSMNNRNSCFIYLKLQRWNLQKSHTGFLEQITTLILPQKLIISMLVDLANIPCALVQEELSPPQQCILALECCCELWLYHMRSGSRWLRGDHAKRNISVHNDELYRGWDTQCSDGSFWEGRDSSLIAFVAHLD